jgi:hypothetical protein
MRRGRRRFLWSLAGVAGCALGGGIFWWRQATRAGILERLTAPLSGSAAAQRLGTLYLERYPDESVPERLASLVLEDVDASALSAGPEDVAAAFRTRTARDFDEGRVVEVDGWILSRTELRVCALAVVLPHDDH